MRLTLSLCFALALLPSAASSQARSGTFLRLDANIVQRKTSPPPATPDARVATLRKLFQDAGCGQRLIEQPVTGALPNLLCATQATSKSIILVAVPLDYTAKGDEAALRWSDLAMLPILAESMGSVVTRHQIVFAALSGHGDGQVGANSYLEQLSPEQRQNVDAIVAFDHLGRYPPAYSVPESGPGVDIRSGRYARGFNSSSYNPQNRLITRSIPAAAQRWNFDLPEKTGEFGVSLTRPFHRTHIQAITFTSPAWTVVRYIGDQPVRDYRTSLDNKVYYDTYLFLSTYLLHLDGDIGGANAGPSLEIAEAQLSARLEAMDSVQKLRAQAPLPAFAPTEVAVAPPPPENAPPPDSNTPVFRTTARLVQVDVVVTDKGGRPIEGLQRGNFTVLQDGRPQDARVFEAHSARDAVAAAPAKPTKPHVLNSYSNQPEATTNQSWNIVLFDLLNTPTEDQQVARNQLRKIAESLPVGQPVALFVLSSHLVMVQPFTTDGGALLSAVKNLELQRSQMLTTEAERQREVGTATYAAKTLTDINIPAIANVPAQNIPNFSSDTTSRLLQSSKDLQSMRLDERVIFTLDAFQGLSRALAGYPGRKNLIWLSGNFPIRLLPDNNSKDKWRYSTSYREKLGRTVALLTESRVAVYPIDIRGMQTRGIDISTSTQQSTAFIGGNSTSLPSTTPDRTSDLVADQTFTGMDERETMTEVAEQTGGRAFVNTNDFNRAIARAVEDGSIYYTLAYAPDNKDDKSMYHRIEVRLDRSDIRLSYRRGYYSQPEAANPKVGLAALQASLQPGMPPSTMLFFTASVKAPEATRKTVKIDYVINASNVTVADAANGAKHIVVDCMAVALDRDGKEAAHASDTLDGTLPAAAVGATLARGLPASQELNLKPGVYNLRLGVQDRESQRVGTLTIPITVE